MSLPFSKSLNLNYENLLRLSEQIGNNGSWIITLNDNRLYLSKRCCDFLCIPRSVDLPDDMLERRIFPEDRESFRKALETIQTTSAFHRMFRFEINGRVRYTENFARFFTDSETGTPYIFGLIHDITDLKEIELNACHCKCESEIISNYLKESSKENTFYGLSNSISRAIATTIDCTMISILIHDNGTLRKIIPSITKNSAEYENIADKDFYANESIRTNQMLHIPVEKHPCRKADATLKKQGAKALYCFPIIHNGRPLAAMSVGIRSESLSMHEIQFCNTLCGYLSAQLSNVILSEQLKDESVSRMKMEQKCGELEVSFELEKMKSKFFANMSHEFKTPLNTILSSLDLLKLKIERNDSSDNIRDSCERFLPYIEQNVYRLLRLTHNLLDAGKISSGFLPAHFECCDIVSTFSGLIKSIEPYATVKGLKLSFLSKLEDTCYFVCDVEMVERILMNLISNAIKNTPHGGKIDIVLSGTPDFMKISVTDNGVGIDEEFLPYLFEEFSSRHLGFTRENEGGGIGLSIVSALVKIHDGTIHVKSKPNHGTEVTFTLSKHLKVSKNITANTDPVLSMRDVRVRMEFSEIN